MITASSEGKLVGMTNITHLLQACFLVLIWCITAIALDRFDSDSLPVIGQAFSMMISFPGNQ